MTEYSFSNVHKFLVQYIFTQKTYLYLKNLSKTSCFFKRARARARACVCVCVCVWERKLYAYIFYAILYITEKS